MNSVVPGGGFLPQHVAQHLAQLPPRHLEHEYAVIVGSLDKVADGAKLFGPDAAGAGIITSPQGWVKICRKQVAQLGLPGAPGESAPAEAPYDGAGAFVHLTGEAVQHLLHGGSWGQVSAQWARCAM